MTDPTVSVVIVSRGRPDALRRSLLGVSQLQYPSFEVVVVADPGGVDMARAAPFAESLKILPFDEPNISAARNLGIDHAAGEIVAFIDDDAVPEPQWLRHLVQPAYRAEVAAMGGFVRGRNGISFQWRARSLDHLGEAQPLEVDPRRPTVLHPPGGRAIKTEGTNMAFRRCVLAELGGFDPAFHYFLDETDLNMRLARAGHATAIVPLAEVHHGFAANALRGANRVPKDLFDIGASWAVFQRKHVAHDDRRAQWDRLRLTERQRLLKYMVSGPLDPVQIRRLMRRLDEGYAEGNTRTPGAAGIAMHPRAPFQPFPSLPRRATVMPTRPIHLRRDRRIAAERVGNGEIVTLICLSLTARYHRVTFEPDGSWLQSGGIFGKSDREMPLLSINSRKRRLKMEQNRVASQRGLREE
ncbi:putative glycosyl transferase [Sulfitobacter sp. THAF37]|uniref:glycosyltransferase family 2 protein n=1 Tax=Sulfitobacter sp. THAF37 TaxID=2587855 RepID=UPI001268BFB6|nr:glycosyltransferase family 2 protein [Sulfitobacter sp. THAF37]QFT58183.1 putative glycosyl transferase [Sulfitobacter sp. THAF37]